MKQQPKQITALLMGGIALSLSILPMGNTQTISFHSLEIAELEENENGWCDPVIDPWCGWWYK